MKTRFLLAVFACSFFSSASWSQVAQDGWTPGYNSNGTQSLYATSNLTQAQAQRSVPTWQLLQGVPSVVQQNQPLKLPNLPPVTVVTKGMVSAAAIFSVFKTIIGGPVGAIVTGLTVVPAVVDWLASGSARFKPGTQTAELERQVNAPCPLGQTCTTYTIQVSSTKYTDSTPGGVCTQVGRKYASNPENADAVGNAISDSQCNIDRPLPYGTLVTWPIAKVSAFNPGLAWVPATIEEIRADMEKLPPFQKPVIDALIKAGGDLPISYAPGSGVTPAAGPASVSGIPVVKKEVSPTTTTTTTTTPKTDLEYGTGKHPTTGQIVPMVTTSVSNTTVTNITNNSTGATTTTTSVVNQPAVEPEAAKEPEPVVFTDSALPDLPKLYERKYPDGFAGVWTAKLAAIKATPLFSLVSGLMPDSIGSSGSCPVWMIPLNFASWSSYGSHDVAPPCWVWEFGKAIIVISSLMLARALVFGG
jgi:hypothetical protein